MPVNQIDGLPTILKTVHGNVASGYILSDDMSLKPCYVAKNERYFAHGATLREATQALEEKVFEDMDADERIELFLGEFALETKYPSMKFFEWHNKLTGSCEMGRKNFADRHNIDLEKGEMTVSEFIALTENSYGGEIIKQLAESIETQTIKP